MALLLGTMAVSPAMATHTTSFTQSGTINGMAPQSKVLFLSATEGQNPCGQPDPDLGDLQGVDGYWFAIPETLGGHAATLTSDSIDMDVWFYNDGCGFIGKTDPNYNSMATDGTANEAGTVPVGAAYVVVDQAIGAHGTFTFSVPA